MSGLEEAVFPDTTLWGYLNKHTVPSLREGARVHVPKLPEHVQEGDTVELSWQAYQLLNGSGPAVANLDLTRNVDPSCRDGIEFRIPYDTGIEPIGRSGSAVVKYRVTRGGQQVDEAPSALVKIDLAVPGEA